MLDHRIAGWYRTRVQALLRRVLAVQDERMASLFRLLLLLLLLLPFAMTARLPFFFFFSFELLRNPNLIHHGPCAPPLGCDRILRPHGAFWHHPFTHPHCGE